MSAEHVGARRSFERTAKGLYAAQAREKQNAAAFDPSNPAPGSLVMKHATESPVVDPYGDSVPLDTLIEIRTREGKAHPEYMHGLKALISSKRVPPPNEEFAYVLTGEGTEEVLQARYGLDSERRPTGRTGQFPNRPQELTARPSVNAVMRPVLDQYVSNIVNETPPMPEEPHLINGYDTYVNPERFGVEVKNLFHEGVVLGGLSQDLPEPNTHRRLHVAGKDVLLTRDAAGTFRCFEATCPRDGAALEPEGGAAWNNRWDAAGTGGFRSARQGSECRYGTDGRLVSQTESSTSGGADHLVELPAQEQFGMLLVVPSAAVAPEEAKRMFSQTMCEQMGKEMECLGLDKMPRVAQQTVQVDANWKLGVDTFGESYHFKTLHPGLSTTFVPMMSVFRPFPYKNGKRHNSCMTLGRYTTLLMASGEVDKSRWAEPSVLDHIVQVYHLAPNVVMLVDQTVFINWFWPGTKPGESFVTIAQYQDLRPQTDLDREALMRRFTGVLDVVATEDFPMLPRMQRNFEDNPHFELVFGRHEPALTDRHKYFAEQVQGLYAPTAPQTHTMRSRM